MKEQELLKKKKEIESAKTELSELKGEEKALMKQLESEWECKTLAEAKKKIQQFETEEKQLLAEITEKTKELEETYFSED